MASLADGETHLAEPGAPGQTVAAHCDGRRFCPLVILPGAPPDPEQACSACWADQPTPATQTRRTTAERVTT
ncbi:MAG: hypothetical protein ACRDTC_15625 [Pseudonocardiaceae bacterium]